MLFDELVTIANRVARKHTGDLGTCILSSVALVGVLEGLGIAARPVRVEAAIFPDDREQFAAILGSRRYRGWLAEAENGEWRGHLAVAVGDEWLLDATIDQANRPEWNGAGMDPLAVALPPRFFWPSGRVQAWANGRDCRARYTIFPNQKSFGKAYDARPSHGVPWRRRSPRSMPAVGLVRMCDFR